MKSVNDIENKLDSIREETEIIKDRLINNEITFDWLQSLEQYYGLLVKLMKFNNMN